MSWDPVIVLEMPGCVLKEVQLSGDIGEFLSPLIAAGANKNFYELLGDIQPDDELCPLETAYRYLRTSAQSPQTRIVVVCKNAGHMSTDKCTYSLFLAHAKLISETEMRVRLLPFPSTMSLWVMKKGLCAGI